MLQIVVRLKERHPLVQLKENAPDTPHVTRVTPPELQNHLRRSVMAGAHYRTVVLLVKGRRAKVDQPNGGVLDAAQFALL